MDYKSIKQSYIYRKYWLLGLLKSRFGKQAVSSANFSAHYFFIHVPKASGTSFRYMLYNHFGQDHVYPNVADLHEYGGGYPKLSELREKDLEQIGQRVELFLGHYPFVVGRKVFPPPVPLRYLVFFREPVSRTISNLYHFQRVQFGNENLSLSEILELRKRYLINMQTRWFCNNPMKIKNRRSKQMLAQAKENLKKVDYIGISEQFDLSIALAQKTFGWDLGDSLNLNTKSKSKKVPQIDDDLMKRIEDICEIDREFYAYALELFNEKVAQAGLSK